MDNETTLDLIYEDPLSDYDVSDDGELDEVLPQKFQSMEIENYEDYEEGELPPDAGGQDSPRRIVAAASETSQSQHEVAGQNLDEVVKEASEKCVGTIRRDHAGQNNGSTQLKRHRSKNKKRKRASVSRFVSDACRHLREKKPALVRAAVDELGLPFFDGLINEVDVIERCGGQMTTDGGRRRTPGGVLWNILKARIDPAVYKHIMYQGRVAEKAKANANQRRQNGGGSDPPTNGPSHVVQLAVHKAKQRKVKAFKLGIEVDVGAEAGRGGDPTPSLDSMPASQHAQNAWSEGIAKSRDPLQKSDAPAVVSKAADGGSSNRQKEKVPVTERLRFPVQYDDLLVIPSSGTEGSKEGVEEGIEEGIEEGVEEGIEEVVVAQSEASNSG